ncbi:probable G-protein coupled receptor Mth-like 7 [Drosophila gunungcola]|uniref:probable G-protein coupled receptor Mth-like 7 n=1 Tax=Drosophila gunungcola TaxID=103775 RepID=UPI0022E81E98|nr:probable G-protein coupled receptor Mth-like 7 [Drosophila gunungcola]
MKEEFCLYPYHFASDFPNTIWIVTHECTTATKMAASAITVVSIICYMLTIAVYLYVKKLRNMIGKCLICTLFCICMSDLTFVLDDFNLLNGICSPAGYSLYFFDIAGGLWNSVFSYHMMKCLKFLRLKEPRYQFSIYSAFVWGTAAIPTGVIFLMNLAWEEDPHKFDLTPLVGFIECSVNKEKNIAWLYYHGPLLILSIFNMIMFVRIATHILTVKKELKKLTDREDETTTCMNFDSQTYLTFLRIFIMTGVTLNLNTISFLVRHNEIGQKVLTISDYFHFAFGAVIFLLVVLKRSTLLMIMDR